MKTNIIYCGDAVKVMQQYIAKNSIDLIVTSPPYDSLRKYKGYSFNFEAIAIEIERVITHGGVVVWVVGDATIKGSESLTSLRQALFFKEIGLNVHDTMIYQKPNFSNPSKNRYHQVWEYMFVFSKGVPKTFNPIMDRENKTAGKKGTLSDNAGIRQSDGSFKMRNDIPIVKPFGMRHNVWLMKTSSQERPCKEKKHPATFPYALAYDHIRTWTKEGNLVLDPMVGSGTTCIASKDLKRDFIGIDCSEEYCNLTKELLKQHKRY